MRKKKTKIPENQQNSKLWQVLLRKRSNNIYNTISLSGKFMT